MPRPFILGLTGSIGMGKSTVAGLFARHGVPVFDADAAVRAMQGPDGRLVPAIEAEFPGTTGPEGVKRQALGAAVFGDKAALSRLEALIHPAVAEERQAFLQTHAESPFVLFDVPLLFEKNISAEVDYIIVVSAPEEVQRARVLAREGMTEAKLDAILALQLPDAEKRACADSVIATDGPLTATEAQVCALLDRLKAMKGL